MTGKKNKTAKVKKEVAPVFEKRATPSFIRRLVAHGIIPPRLFISALVIARNNSFLQRYGVSVLMLTGLLYILCSAFLLLGYEWSNIPFLFKPAATLFMLAAACIYAQVQGTDSVKGQVAILLSCVFTGALLYLGFNNPVSFTFVWIVFFGWFIIISPWVFVIKKDSVTVFWLSVFVCALVLWGVEYALPWGILNWSEFFSLSAVCMFVILSIREFCVFHYKWKSGCLTRLLPLFYSFALGLTPVILSAFGLNGGSLSLSAVVFLLLFILSFGMYYMLFYDKMALISVIFFFCAFCVVLAYINYLKYDGLLSSFALIVIPFGFFSWFTLRLHQSVTEEAR